VGLLLGSAAMFVLASRTPRTVVVEADDSEVREREQLLDQRVAGVSARERALAAHAGKLAAREEELTSREEDLDASAAKLEASERELEAKQAAAPQPQPEPIPEPIPEPAPEPAEPTLSAPTGTWNLRELQRLVDAATATPEQTEKWRTYLFFLREHASADGSLPRSLNGLMSDVFGELLD
jgi:hypothetical protein